MTHGYVSNEDTGDRYEWWECESEEGCIVIHRIMNTTSGMKDDPEERDAHIPRLVLESIVQQMQEAK